MMTNVFKVSEWRAYVKISTLLGKRPSEILEDLCTVIKDQVPGKTQVYEWCNRFAEGRASLDDDKRDGRPTSVTHVDNLEKVKAILISHPHSSIRDISDGDYFE